MHEIEPLWNNWDEEAERLLRPALAERVLAEAGRQRRALRELRTQVRVMLFASLTLSLAILGYIGYNGWVVAPQRQAEWAQAATLVGNFDIN